MEISFEQPHTDGSQGLPTGRAEHVRALALALFDRTCPLHGLADDSRHTLEAAALLVDHLRWKQPPFAYGKKKNKIAQRLAESFAGLETLTAQQLTRSEQNILAAVIALHHGKIKRKDLDHFDLTSIQQREALTLAAMLHIADGLDASGTGSTTIQSIEPTRQGMWLIIDGPQAAADAQSAQVCTRLWAKIGYPAITIMETAEAAEKLLPFPSPEERISIIPSEPLVEAARKIMRYHFAQMLKHEAGTRLGEDIEALHDMRVATRRLRAAFEVFNEVFEPGALKPYLKGLRAAGRALGAVRDLDVLLEKGRSYQDAQPEGARPDLSSLFVAWEAQRQQARQQMMAFLDSREYAIFRREFNNFLATPGAGARRTAPPATPDEPPTPERVSELVPVLVFERLAAVLAFDPFPPDVPLERLHALRIAFKKLRYTVEYFRQTLGPRAEEIIEELKGLQDHLGDLNDAKIASELLANFIAAAGPEGVDAAHLGYVRQYQDHQLAEMQRLFTTFPAAWEHFKRRQFRQSLAKAVACL